MERGDWLSACAAVNSAAIAGFLQGLHEEVVVTKIPWHFSGVQVTGLDGTVYFEENDGKWVLKVFCFAKSADAMRMPVTLNQAIDMLANLTVAEIADWIERAKNGENPSLTDYVDEAI